MERPEPSELADDGLPLSDIDPATEPETLADDGLPLSDIDPATGWMYGEVGA
jgi:hypothetical protein